MRNNNFLLSGLATSVNKYQLMWNIGPILKSKNSSGRNRPNICKFIFQEIDLIYMKSRSV